jgi:hypothetical protein
VADGLIEEFKAWVWKPPYWSWRVRGRSNAVLQVYRGRLTVTSRFRVGGWPEIEYRWPTVVLQTLWPFGAPTILFETDGKLASCWVRSGHDRLRGVLEQAGFAVVEVRRLGWEAPHPVSEAVLGTHAQHVPNAIIG